RCRRPRPHGGIRGGHGRPARPRHRLQHVHHRAHHGAVLALRGDHHDAAGAGAPAGARSTAAVGTGVDGEAAALTAAVGGWVLRPRTLRAFMLAGAQRALSLVVTAAGGIAVARLLLPDVFGSYAIISFAVTLGVVFSDVGLGAALIQRRELASDAALTAAFVAQLALAALLGGALVVLAPVAVAWLGAPAETAGALRAVRL